MPKTKEKVKALPGAAGAGNLTPQLLKTRRLQYENGIINALGVTNTNDVSVATYKKLARNPTIKMGLSLLRGPVQATKRSIQADDDNVAEFLNTYIMPQSDTIIKYILDSMEIGFSVSEMVWKDVRFNEKLHLYPAQYVSIDPEYVRFLKKNGEYAGIQVTSPIPVTIDGNKTVLSVWAEEYGDLYGIPITRAAYNAWLSLQYVQLNANRHFEQQGSPAPIVYYPDDVDDDGNYVYKADAEAIAQTLGSSGYAVMPKRDDNERVWEIEYLIGDTSGDNFISYMSYLDTLMLRGVLLPDGTATRSGSETGSYAERAAAVELLTPNLDEISERVDAIFQEQIIDRVLYVNFPEGTVAKVVSEPISKWRQELLFDMTEKVIVSQHASPETKEIADELYAGLTKDRLGIE